MKTESIFAVLGALAVVAGIAVVLLKRWSAKPDKWQSKIAPQTPPPPVETPAAQRDWTTEKIVVEQPPILPPEKKLPKQEQPRRK